MKNPIYPCLWFAGNAAEAANFYCSVFNNSKITTENHLVVSLELSGQKFLCLNGGPEFVPNPSVSFFVVLDTEQEVDDAWKKLLESGNVLMPLDKYEWSEKYGWVQDRFGVSWQLAYGRLEDVGQRFTPSLLFTDQNAGKAEEALLFYTSVFKDSSVDGIARYTAEDPDTEGWVKHAQFRLGASVLSAMDSSLAHDFTFNEAISLVVNCDDQAEIDYYWDRLTEGGEESMCGWLKDRYGVSWQIIPAVLEKMMSDPGRAQAVADAFLQMKKFDLEKLKEAYERG